MVLPLHRVVVRGPHEAFGAADPSLWHYSSKPDLQLARQEHEAFVELLRDAGAEVLHAEAADLDGADSIYPHDPCIITDAGAILLRMGKTLRRGEPAALGRILETMGVPTLASLRGDALAEGGDLLWLDRRTLAVGQGYRTNVEGLRQLRRILQPLNVNLVPVPLPHHRGPQACLHLMSLISLVDRDLAVIYQPLLPVPFLQSLLDRGIRLVKVPDAEFDTMGANVLALAPRRGLMLEGNPLTRERLESAGCSIETYRGNEISLKAEGGPTCLTRPILRS